MKTKVFISLVLMLFCMYSWSQDYFRYIVKDNQNVQKELRIGPFDKWGTAKITKAPTNITSYRIPPRIYYNSKPFFITHIDAGAFASSNIRNFIVEKNSFDTWLTHSMSFGDEAFLDCEQLTSIELHMPCFVGKKCFCRCKELKSITFYGDAYFNSVPEGAFCGCSKLQSIRLGSVCSKIGNYAFEGCESLSYINLDWRIDKIGEFAFKDCKQLSSIGTLRLSELGMGAFWGCENLRSIKFDTDAQLCRLEAFTFSGCKSLTSINIPKRVKYIGKYVFGECTSLQSIIINSPAITISTEFIYQLPNFRSLICLSNELPKIEIEDGEVCMDYNTIKNATLYVPRTKMWMYKTTLPWSRFGAIKPVEDYALSLIED